MFDIASFSAIVATISVIVGVTFAVLQLRHIVKTRQARALLERFGVTPFEVFYFILAYMIFTTN